MKPRKMLPAPKCTQIGFSFVFLTISATSYFGSATPAFSHASRLKSAA